MKLITILALVVILSSSIIALDCDLQGLCFVSFLINHTLTKL